MLGKNLIEDIGEFPDPLFGIEVVPDFWFIAYIDPPLVRHLPQEGKRDAVETKEGFEVAVGVFPGTEANVRVRQPPQDVAKGEGGLVVDAEGGIVCNAEECFKCMPRTRDDRYSSHMLFP
jgi:hypothetical protein